jgi:hypothetical protein
MLTPIKPIVSASILAIVLASPVLAQDAANPPGTAPAPDSKAAMGTTTETPLFIPEQKSDQVLAKSIIGAHVVDIGGNEVGTVKDLILDKDGNAVGVVVSWGGVLGIGAKAVGISFGPAQLHQGERPETKLVRLTVTKEAVEAGPQFMDEGDRRSEAARSTGPRPAADREKARP